ncbi:hypothetical protein ElyMa_006442300 [Elysia marginata]|uniref:Uncharacterized protein n=1 Tax=Elysia marginata TaxID=1093978 RepID=A0AAV4HVS5_9GAST|nr:hypothetical protein ElyMa_006442300 [Elysia marginata]
MVNNEATDTRKGFEQRFPLPSNGQNNVSSTIGNMSTDTTFLFRDAGINKFNRVSGTSFKCQEVAIVATTDTAPTSTIIPFQDEVKEKNSEDDRGGFKFNMIYIITTVSRLTCIIILRTVATVICKRRASAKNKH